MVATAFVRARIDETLKNEASAVLADMGLTVSDVVAYGADQNCQGKSVTF